ncbi:MAG: DUF4190 domain-containing protein [Pirellulales bacterium]|nr:DUF4190 domain-containing protein [Pirellulales bacterium]
MAASYGTVPEACPHCGLPLARIELATLAPLLCPACRRQVRAAIKPHLPASGRAVASLVLAALSPVGSFITGLAAILLGLLALRDIRRRPTQVGGRGIAIGGMLTGALLSVACLPCHASILMALLLNYRGEERVVAEEAVDDAKLQELLASWQLGTLPPGLKPVKYRPVEAPTTGTSRWLLLADDAPCRHVVALLATSQQDTLDPDLFRSEAEPWMRGRADWQDHLESIPDLESHWQCQVRGRAVEVTERYYKAEWEDGYVAEFQAMVVQPDGTQYLLWTALLDLPGPVEQIRAAAREPVRTFLESW